MDLTPRTSTPNGEPSPVRKRRWMPIIVVALAIIGGGVVVTQFLTSAIDYYCNVDEVGVREGCDGERRMRVQGVVEQSSIKQNTGSTSFSLDFNGKSLAVKYEGDPGGVFQECIPVVAHGRIVNGVLESNRIEVKHSNQYVEKNDDRLDKSDKEAAACSVSEG